LSEKVGSFKQTAKNTLSRLRKAVSLERLDKTGKSSEPGGMEDEPQKMSRTPSFRSLTERLSFRKKHDKYVVDSTPNRNRPPSGRFKRPQSAPANKGQARSQIAISEPVDKPTHFRAIGKLRKLNSDGTQVVELVKPPHGPFGFYIGRGNAQYNHGVFVSRLSDSLPERFFAGLIGLGDEILEINNVPLHSLTLDQVYDLMAEKNKLILKTLPFMARKDQ